VDPLLEEVASRGAFGGGTLQWVRSHQAATGLSIDATLLELDLIDEDSLLAALGARFGMPVAKPSDIERIEPDLATAFPEGFGRSFGLCPLRRSGNEVVVLVERPLAAESIDELRDLFRITPKQVLGAWHQMALARARVYGAALPDRCKALEDKLSARRNAVPIARVLSRVSESAELGAAVDALLEFATARIEYACLLSFERGALRVIRASGRGAAAGASVPLPKAPCSISAAARYGGYFVGSPSGEEGDVEVYAALERPVPRCAVIAPVARRGDTSFLFCADNGSNGIATTWVAELTLLTSRLGQRGGDLGALARETPEPPPKKQESEPPVPIVANEPAPSAPAQAEPAIDPTELSVLDRLRTAARASGLPIGSFLDELLRDRAVRGDAATSAALVGEVRGLFERLATDIPTQLARGLESAFRDLVPRVAAGTAPIAQPRAAEVAIVRSAPETPREVQSYQSRRRKAPIVKL